LEQGLSHDSFYGAQLHGQVAYHEFEGITVNLDERSRMLASIGEKKCVILRNHGLLSWGHDIAEAFMWLWTRQRACDVQVAAGNAGALHAVSAQARAQCVREAGPLEPAVCAAVYAALVRRLDDAGVRYAD
jgi:ribulose-5-phosphate 4-epimerase/fuculose-1-phosphate aldolase